MDFSFLKFIKDYLPVVAVFVSAFIAFISTIRHKDLERFYKNAENNLEQIIEPMYYRIKYIEGINNADQKLKNINVFFEIYNFKTINISKMGNRRLIDLFFETEAVLNQYLSNKDDKTEELLLSKVRRLYLAIEKEYWRLFEAIYKDYNWYKKTVDMNYVFRFLSRIFLFIEQTLYAATWIVLGFILIITVENIFNEGNLVEALKSIGAEGFQDIIIVLLMFFFILLIFLYIFVFANEVFVEDTRQKKRIRDYATAGFTLFVDKVIEKIREWKKERANRKEERERTSRSEGND
ncbi:hypothetical protein [Bacillus swezeyi]|uniref:Uncharacterized protein n=1 Tax=Bacillus swezeyi TaxID=1925020 RepID=A0A5M8RP94_9BACI|nr:hypothetical protein [Bacillus swezeyi]KAA6450355.1 hypothetical protein DX927_05610 [Bacillus swezeyi]KAA6482240.1 hypothetical protein DX928_03815 [Bacillus swezeyi]TYS36896.1 hypothetical protein FZC77_05465 [Bacillus swezeyi]